MTRRTTWLARSVTAVACATVLAGTACSGSPGPTAASGTSSSVPASSTTSTSPSSSAPAPTTISARELTAKFVAAAKAGGDYRLSANGSGVQLTAAVHRTATGSDMLVRSTDSSGTTELRLIHGVAYIKSPDDSSSRPWLKIDPRAHDAVSRQFAPQFAALTSEVDLASKAKLFSSLDDFSVIGQDTLDGHPVTGYRTRASLDQLASGLAAKDLATMRSSGVSGIDYTLWLDRQWLIYRADVAIVGGSAASTLSTFLRAWGTRVVIAAPPAGSVHSP